MANAQRFPTGVDLMRNGQLKGAILEQWGALPGTPVTGEFGMDPTSGHMMYRAAGAWLDVHAIIAGSVTLASLAANSVDSSKIVDGSIVNADINGSAAIARAKLDFGSGLVNADIAAAAGIVYSKLVLGGNVVNADISATAAIARSKLDFGSGLVNADIAAAAAIGYAKLNLGNSIVNADINTTAAIAYTKLNLTGSIVNADIGASAAIAYSKLNLAGAIQNSDLAGSIALSKLATDPLARANHTGTQLAATISNFDTQVRTSRLDQMAAPTSAVGMGAQKITNLADPTVGSDAATKNYVDLMRQGIRLKDAVRVVATTNGTLATAYAAGQVVDGVTLVLGDRILLAGQTTTTENGIYIVTAGAPTRATDADTAAELNDGATTFVQEGTANNAKTYAQISPIANLATDAQSWTIQGAAASYIAGNGLGLVGSTFSVTAADGTINVSGSGVKVGTLIAANFPTGGSAIITSGMIVDGTIVDADIAAGAAIAVSKVAGAMTRSTFTIGDGVASSFVCNHARGNQRVIVQVDDAGSPFEVIQPTIKKTDANNVTVDFGTYVPATNSFVVTVIG